MAEVCVIRPSKLSGFTFDRVLDGEEYRALEIGQAPNLFVTVPYRYREGEEAVAGISYDNTNFVLSTIIDEVPASLTNTFVKNGQYGGYGFLFAPYLNTISTTTVTTSIVLQDNGLWSLINANCGLNQNSAVFEFPSLAWGNGIYTAQSNAQVSSYVIRSTTGACFSSSAILTNALTNSVSGGVWFRNSVHRALQRPAGSAAGYMRLYTDVSSGSAFMQPLTTGVDLATASTFVEGSARVVGEDNQWVVVLVVNADTGFTHCLRSSNNGDSWIVPEAITETTFNFGKVFWGKGRFGEDMLVTLESGGEYGFFSKDWGETWIEFRLPADFIYTNLGLGYSIRYREGSWFIASGTYGVYRMYPDYTYRG